MSALWTLPGVEPVPRVESIPAIVVDVLTKDRLPMDQRLLARRVESVLRARGRKLNEATLRQEITRLIEKGVVEFHGANEHGPMFALTVREGESDLN
jgi:repressor of nif and glnA expression